MDKPLAKALHTVTAVTRIAEYESNGGSGMTAEALTLHALSILGYTEAQALASPALFAACVAAVSRAT